MNKILFESGRFVIIVLVLLTCFAVYHYFALKKERKKIIPNGNMIDVNGRKIHVYTQGKHRPKLVFLAGSASVSPVYDFKSVYNKLSDQYKIIVVEKTGYGYSDTAHVARDITSIVEEERSALCSAGEKGPYILAAHSMGGLEAIYWTQNYPDEVQGIIGFDMAVPEVYEKMNIRVSLWMMRLLQVACFFGIQRIPGVYSLNTEELDENEKKQQKLLLYSYRINENFRGESEKVRDNAETVKNGGNIHVPLLMFISNGLEIGKFWIPCEQRFAAENHGETVQFKCGHYIHHYESVKIVEEIKKFVIKIL